MRRLGVYSLSVIAAAALAACGSGQPTLQVAPNQNLSNSAGWDGEPSISVNPLNNKNVVVAWMSATKPLQGEFSLATRATTDGGRTWGPLKIIPHADPSYHSADPTLVFDLEGRAHLAYIDHVGSDPEGAVKGGLYHTISADGGKSWSVPVLASDAGDTTDTAIDRPWLAVDESAKSGGQFVYLVSRAPNGSPLPHHVHLRISKDGGQSWSADVSVDSDQLPALAGSLNHVAVGADGQVYVKYLGANTPRCGKACIVIAESRDHGKTWRRNVALTGVATATGYDYRDRLAANPAKANELAFTWSGRYNGSSDEADAWLSRSTDGGATWSKPVRVNDDTPNKGTGHDFATLNYGPDGQLCVAWRDRRDSGPGDKNVPFRIYASCSKANSFSMGPNEPISDATSPSPEIPAGNDFFEIGVAQQRVYAAWGDHRTSTAWVNWESFFGSISL